MVEQIKLTDESVIDIEWYDDWNKIILSWEDKRGNDFSKRLLNRSECVELIEKLAKVAEKLPK